MLDALPLDARALAAAVALAVLPGVLVVRAPWRALPLVSLAFWVTSWTWPLGASRTRLLQVALIAFTALSLFRVMRPGPLPGRGRAQGLLALVALLLLVPYARPGVPSGSRAPMDALAAELLAWHDGWPASFEPLSPARPFAASGLATFAADDILLSGAAPHRAVFAVTVVAHVALLFALFGLASVSVSPGRAAAMASAAVVPAAAMGEASGALAAAFAVEAAWLWHDRRGHASAFTAGACVAAGLATDPATTAISLLLALRLTRPGPHRAASAMAAGRSRTEVWTAIVLALPLLWRVPRLETPDPVSITSVAVLGLVSWITGRAAPAGRVAAAGLLAVWAATGLVLGGVRRSDVTPDEVAAMTWIRDHAGPLDLVCAPDVPSARWIPGLAARATTALLRPGWPIPEGACAARISLSGRLPPGLDVKAPPSFRAGSAAVWTNSEDR